MGAILVTGASSGLGAELARFYARPGTHLVLWGRNEVRLDATVAECRKRGAEVDVGLVDLRDADRAVSLLREADRRSPLVMAIFNAGVGGTIPPEQALELPERAHEVATVNFTAVVVGATTAAALMTSRGRGHIVIIGSIAESFPLPMAPTYAGAKAGIAMFAEALGLRLKGSGVSVTLVSAGFIDTPMSRQVTTPKPFLLSAEKAAAIIARRIARKPRRIAVPWQFGVIRVLALTLPRALTRSVLNRF